MSSYYVKSIIRKIDTNSTLMETNPAFYHEPDDVKIEVNPVGSGPSQEHFTDQVTSIFLNFVCPDLSRFRIRTWIVKVLKCAW